MKEITREWINKAEKDFKVALREIRSEDPIYDAVCFHSQQCVEKYLKAILQENEIYIEKTHDLWKIAKDCIPFLKEIQDYKDRLINLSEYAVEIRYPGSEDITIEESMDCFETCKKIREVVRDYFGLEE